ncbi:MAG: ribonuclease P protein component [Gammaproteobacteria bacterium]|nr:ribonuclease P protein component [Gammaproteobacteria bacterium]
MPVKTENDSCRPAGFPRSYRLRNANQFRAVFNEARRASDQNFTLLGRCNDKNHARLGLAISVKSAGGAVCRNRVKRAARESFRLLGGDISSVDVVVMARRGIDKKTSAQMRASLDKLFRSISRKCAKS